MPCRRPIEIIVLMKRWNMNLFQNRAIQVAVKRKLGGKTGTIVFTIAVQARCTLQNSRKAVTRDIYPTLVGEQSCASKLNRKKCKTISSSNSTHFTLKWRAPGFIERNKVLPFPLALLPNNRLLVRHFLRPRSIHGSSTWGARVWCHPCMTQQSNGSIFFLGVREKEKRKKERGLEMDQRSKGT